MGKVVSDKFVSVDYKGTLENGEVFDSSEGRQPLEVKVGAGQVIKGFEDALMGMEMNEKKTFTLDPDEAYGERDENLMHDFPKANVPPNVDPQVGQMIGLQTQDGRQVPAQVVSVDDEKVVLDLNHPLAGKSLTFDVEVVGISDMPTQAPAGCGDCAPDGGCSCGC